MSKPRKMLIVVGIVVVSCLASLPFLRIGDSESRHAETDGLTWQESPRQADLQLDIRRDRAMPNVTRDQPIPVRTTPFGGTAADEIKSPSIRALTPVERSQPPPDIPRKFVPFRSRTDDTDADWSVASEHVQWPAKVPSVAGSPEVIEHVVVDGDTLASLAERYLGDPKRSQEIFEANEDVLSSPQLIPINARLKIPRE